MTEKTNRKKKKSPVFLIIIIACIAVMAFAAYNLIRLQLEYKEGRDEYEGLQQYATVKTAGETAARDADGEKASGKESASGDAGAEEETAPIVPHMKCPIEVDFAPLKEINRDVIGWIYVGAVDVSYPVVQGKDNDYYLHRTFMNTENFAGSIFMESANKPDFSDPNTILYGHNMKDQSMFAKLRLLTDEEKYKNDPYIWILTPEHTYRYRMFSLHRVSYDGPVYTLFSGPSKLVTDYISECAADSLVPLDISDANEKSRLITLSTCTAADTERYAAQGILDQID